MTATLFMRMQVENFDTWLNPNTEEVDQKLQRRRSVGVRPPSKYRVGADVMMSGPS